MKARTQALNQMKALIATAPLELRYQLAGLHCWQPAKVAHFETREIRGWMKVW